jgi:hypothetical protein
MNLRRTTWMNPDRTLFFFCFQADTTASFAMISARRWLLSGLDKCA